MLISYYANKKSSPRLPSWQPSLIFFNIPIESGTIIKPCTLKHFQVTYMLHKAGYWTMSICSVEHDILNRNFTVDEIKSSINSLRNKKSPGIDCIPAEFLKHCRDVVSDDITELFNYIIENGDFPETWAEGLRNPIFKTRLKIETCNYRGIIVLQIFEKIFEIAAQKRLEFVSEAFRKTDRYNGGFLKGSRTTDNLFILSGLIERQLDTGQSLIVCNVDFTQAFDRVNRNILFYKIKKSGLTGRVIDTLQNLYTKTRFRVKCNREISDIVRENLGVNQGGNASPILFRKYLSDIKEYLDEYTGIWQVIKSYCICSGLMTYTWCQANRTMPSAN